MRRLAVITDIHANLPALQAALARIDELEIDDVLLRRRSRRLRPAPERGLRAHRRNARSRRSTATTTTRSPATSRTAAARTSRPTTASSGSSPSTGPSRTPTRPPRTSCATLPFDLHFELGAHRVHLVHGSPRKVNEYLFEDKPARLYERLAAAETDRRPRLRAHAQAVGARLRRRALRQLRLGRQAQGRRPPRRLRGPRPRPSAASRRGSSASHTTPRPSHARSPRPASPSEFADKLVVAA